MGSSPIGLSRRPWRISLRLGRQALFYGWAWPFLEWRLGFLLVMSSKVSRKDNLQRRGLSLEESSGLCVICDKEREDINPLFLHCALFLWCRFLASSSVSWCVPKSVALLVESWRLTLFFFFFLFEREGVMEFDSIWSVWNERNSNDLQSGFES